ncbi:hypothetical protein BDZ94DRAFT_767889 [Collybia nuda]|uniref:Uncharacterized protein n=1 Tax=Collybia nuda TaxID=64659 RepID=A0A9P5Y5B3_9AGAR|nr:hypothetical protein BDZ94DRAFT_767889 [Collybia nuda]
MRTPSMHPSRIHLASRLLPFASIPHPHPYTHEDPCRRSVWIPQVAGRRWWDAEDLRIKNQESRIRNQDLPALYVEVGRTGNWCWCCMCWISGSGGYTRRRAPPARSTTHPLDLLVAWAASLALVVALFRLAVRVKSLN